LTQIFLPKRSPTLVKVFDFLKNPLFWLLFRKKIGENSKKIQTGPVKKKLFWLTGCRYRLQLCTAYFISSDDYFDKSFICSDNCSAFVKSSHVHLFYLYYPCFQFSEYVTLLYISFNHLKECIVYLFHCVICVIERICFLN